jgi:hypothetical protein
LIFRHFIRAAHYPIILVSHSFHVFKCTYKLRLRIKEENICEYTRALHLTSLNKEISGEYWNLRGVTLPEMVEFLIYTRYQIRVIHISVLDQLTQQKRIFEKSSKWSFQVTK